MNDLTSQMKSPQRIASFADNPLVLLLHFTEEIPSYIRTKLKIQISSTYMRNSISFTIVPWHSSPGKCDISHICGRHL
jgi:hypothetical protein